MKRFINDEIERREYTFSQIKKSFEKHYSNCESYQKYCDLYSFNTTNLNEFDDLFSIPQIPTAIFKSIDVNSVDKNKCKCCTSSGTKGIVSKIYRDEPTIQAFVDAIKETINVMYGITVEECVVFNLGPSLEESGDIWIAYVMGFLKYVVETYNFMHSQIVETDALIDKIKNYDSSKRIVLLGAPSIFLKVFSDMEKEDIKIKMPKNTIVFTAGGWKSKEGNTLTRETLCEMFKKYFDINEDQYFDIYNQVESNTPFFECKCHKKHIPAGFLAIVRDPVTLEKMNDGEEGIITFLDSTSNSYPAFVITDDIGSVTDKCECGLEGQIFNYTRRVKTVETKGCALKLDQKIT